MLHYTDQAGFNGIRAAPHWLFRAATPPGDHPRGAYFTDYGTDTPKLAEKLRIPRTKLQFLFSFTDAGDLQRLRGGRGVHIFYSEGDYTVVRERQIAHGASGL